MFLKGDAVEVNLTIDGQVSKVLNFVKSIEITPITDIESAEYLGLSSDLTDETFNGADATLEIDQKSAAYLDYIALVVRRAKSRQPGEEINISTKVEFPDGAVRRILLPDVKHRSPSFSAGSRKARVSGRIEVHSDTIKFPNANI